MNRPWAIDGHAKNFSVFLLPGGAYRLTPRYDILSAYPVMGHGRGKLSPEKIRLAMAVQGKNHHYHWKEVQGRHWLETAKRCGFGDMQSVIEEVIAKTPEVLQQIHSVIPRGFPLHISDSILKGVRACSEGLKKGMSLS